MTFTAKSPYAGYRFPGEVISHAVSMRSPPTWRSMSPRIENEATAWILSAAQAQLLVHGRRDTQRPAAASRGRGPTPPQRLPRGARVHLKDAGAGGSGVPVVPEEQRYIGVFAPAMRAHRTDLVHARRSFPSGGSRPFATFRSGATRRRTSVCWMGGCDSSIPPPPPNPPPHDALARDGVGMKCSRTSFVTAVWSSLPEPSSGSFST